MEEVLIFANPIAGRGAGATIADRLGRRLSDEGYRTVLMLDPPDGLEFPQRHTSARAALVIGGDGTLRSVTQRMIQLGLDDPPPLLPVPLGTANLMGRHLGIRWDEFDLANHVSAAIARRRVAHFDVGRANGHIFLLMVGVGFDAQIVHEMDRIRSGPIHLASYVFPTVSAVGHYAFETLCVVADGQEVFSCKPGVAFVGNVAEYGTGFPVLSRARPNDGLLDICILPCQSHADLAQWALLAAAGEHLQGEGAVYLTASHVQITSETALPVQVDGDAAGHTPVEISLLPLKLPFIVP